jgi:hypothetical protein
VFPRSLRQGLLFVCWSARWVIRAESQGVIRAESQAASRLLRVPCRLASGPPAEPPARFPGDPAPLPPLPLAALRGLQDLCPASQIAGCESSKMKTSVLVPEGAVVPNFPAALEPGAAPQSWAPFITSSPRTARLSRVALRVGLCLSSSRLAMGGLRT